MSWPDCVWESTGARSASSRSASCRRSEGMRSSKLSVRVSSPVDRDELSTKPPWRFVTAVTWSASRAISSAGDSSSIEIERSIRLSGRPARSRPPPPPESSAWPAASGAAERSDELGASSMTALSPEEPESPERPSSSGSSGAPSPPQSAISTLAITTATPRGVSLGSDGSRRRRSRGKPARARSPSSRVKSGRGSGTSRTQCERQLLQLARKRVVVVGRSCREGGVDGLEVSLDSRSGQSWHASRSFVMVRWSGCRRWTRTCRARAAISAFEGRPRT